MLRLVRQLLGAQRGAMRSFVRYQATASVTPESDTVEGSEETVRRSVARERAISEALAKEEEGFARARMLREMKEETKNMISTLNKTPSTLISSRLKKIQQELDNLPDQGKVKQLNEELEEFLNKHMNLPKFEIQNRPWAKISNSNIDELKTSSDNTSTSQTIRSTASTSIFNQFPQLKPTPNYKPYSEQELFLRHLSHTRNLGNLGSNLTDIYLPKDDIRKPQHLEETSISTLMAAGCHLGHAKSQWRPSTQPFIYGEYNGIHLIDLNETLTSLKKASRVIKGVSEKGGVILYVGTSKSQEQHLALEAAAKRSQGYYISKRWIPGTITNFVEVTRQLSGELRHETDLLNQSTGRDLLKEADDLIKPDLVVILNPVENRNCVNECIILRVPTIGLCDTDMEPSLLTYPIPCNDDNIRSTNLMVGVLSKAAQDGLQMRIDKMTAYKKTQNKQKLKDELNQLLD